MSGERARKIPVYAIVRLDLDVATPDLAVAIKEIVPTLQDAEAEVQRLNLLNSENTADISGELPATFQTAPPALRIRSQLARRFCR
jgi:hypothetical protein